MDSYHSSNIKNEALIRIRKCLEIILTIESAIAHYRRISKDAEMTIDKIKQMNEDYNFNVYLPSLYKKRVYYLQKVIKECSIIVDDLEKKLPPYYRVINELEKAKNTSIFEKVIGVMTAPIKHAFNIINGILENDGEKVIKSGILIGLGVIGVGVIGDAIDALEGIEVMDPELISIEDPDIHYVESHTRTLDDGSTTIVDGHLRTNPDGDVTNNLSS